MDMLKRTALVMLLSVSTLTFAANNPDDYGTTGPQGYSIPVICYTVAGIIICTKA